MAIKGKGKTKGRQPARAPRRAPVEVKPPFFLRRRVQVALAFVAGLLVMMLAVWITNGLRQQRADDTATTEASQQRAAGQKWKAQVEAEFGKIGTISPGAPPALFPELTTTIAALQKGKVPDDATSTLTKTQAGAKSAAANLQAYKLSESVRDIGMDEGQVSWFLNSQARYVQALGLYEQAAVIAALAVDAPDGPASGHRGLGRGHPEGSRFGAAGRLQRLPERARVRADLRLAAHEPHGSDGVGAGA